MLCSFNEQINYLLPKYYCNCLYIPNLNIIKTINNSSMVIGSKSLQRTTVKQLWYHLYTWFFSSM